MQCFCFSCDYELPFYLRLTHEPAENTLTEVDIRVQPLDLVVSPSTLRPFTEVYKPWLLLKLPDTVRSMFSSSADVGLSHVPEEPSDMSQEPTTEGGSVVPPPPMIKVSEPLGLTINNRTLPLLYLHLEGLRVFLPGDKQHEDDHKTCGQDLVLLQIASLLISPQVNTLLKRLNSATQEQFITISCLDI